MANVGTVISVMGLLVGMLSIRNSEAVKLLLSETDGNVNIRNCSNCIFSIECKELTCECSDVSVDDVANAAGADVNVTWWYSEDLEICCNSLSSAAAQTVLAQLLDFSYMTQVGLKQCHELATTGTDQWITIFGLRELYMTAPRSSTYTSKTFDLQGADEDHSDQSQEYRDYHIAFVARNIVDGEVGMWSWSIVEQIGNENTTQTIAAALARSPDVIRSKADSTFMWSPIYGV